jgi:hypothetical protein
VLDTIGALMAGQGELTALLHRERTGEGQRVDVSLLAGTLLAHAARLSIFLATGEEPGRWGSGHPYPRRPTASGTRSTSRPRSSSTAGASTFTRRPTENPEEPYSCSGSPLVFANGRTEMDGRSRRTIDGVSALRGAGDFSLTVNAWTGAMFLISRSP